MEKMIKNGNKLNSSLAVGNFVSLPEGEQFVICDPEWSEARMNYPVRFAFGIMLLCRKGTAVLSINLQEYHLEHGTQVLVIPNTTAMLLSVSADFRASCFAFTSQMFDEASYRLDLPFFRFLSDHPVSLHTPETFEPICLWFEMMRHTYDDRDHIFRNTIVRNRLQNMFMEYYDKIQRKKLQDMARVPDRQTDLCRRFFNLVGENCRSEHRVEWYAERLCVTTRYLSAITREGVHMTPKEVIDRLLMLEIRLLLETSGKTVQEIADATGFRDQAYLSRYFRRQTGQSISEYRRIVK